MFHKCGHTSNQNWKGNPIPMTRLSLLLTYITAMLKKIDIMEITSVLQMNPNDVNAIICGRTESMRSRFT